MKFNRTFRITAFAIGAVVVIGLLTWAFVEGRKEFLAEQERERPVKPPSRVHSGEGNSIVVLDSVEQARAGIITDTVPLSTHQQQVRAYGSVVSVAELANAFQNLASTKSQSQKTKAVVSASHQEYLRIKDLYERKLESDKTLQAAQAQWESDDAAAQAGTSALRSFESSMRQQWGEPLASWLFKNSEQLDRLLKSQDVLVEVTLSADEHLSPTSRSVFVQSPSNQSDLQSARFVSMAQSANVQFQGSVLYYLARPSSNTLLGGMNVNVFLPTGSKREGVVVPRSSVVWSLGKAWFYVKKDAGKFVRVELTSDQPVEGGWFVARDKLDVSVPIHIVTRGAQLLLSEEFRSQIQVGEESERE